MFKQVGQRGFEETEGAVKRMISIKLRRGESKANSKNHASWADQAQARGHSLSGRIVENTFPVESIIMSN